MKGLSISDRANIIMKYHKMLDGAEERQRGAKGVGTTGRGIGPCYSDKIARSGIRMCDILDEEALKEKMDLVYPVKEKLPARPGRSEAGTKGTAGQGTARFRETPGAVRRGRLGAGERCAQAQQESALRRCPGNDAGHRPRHLSLRHIVQLHLRRHMHRRGRRTEQDQRGPRE